MKKLISLFTIAFCFFLAMSASAQNVNVNPGAGTYPTLKAAFDAINGGTHTGAVTVDIIVSTVEPLMATLNASGVGAASYTSVVITTSVGGVSVAGTDSVTIKLAGADNVTLDGRISGSGRNITVSNSSIFANATAIWLAHGGFAVADSAGAQNNIIRNCEINCGVSVSTATTVTNGILSSGNLRTANGRNNDNNQYLENRIIKCRLGISLNGGSALNTNDNNIISGNIVGPSSNGSDNIGATGILTQFQNLCSITNNSVQFVGGLFATTTAGSDRCGIGVGTGTWSASSTTTTTGSNYTVTGNVVHDIIEERTFSSAGMIIGVTLSGPKTNNLIANNVVYNVRANGTAGDQCVGIGSAGGPGDRFIFNSVSITGDMDPAGTTTASSSPIAVGIAKHLAAAADTAALFSDNSILVDANTNTTTLLKAPIVGPAVGYAWGSGGLRNNDYWVPNFLNGNVTGVAGTGTVSFSTLALWVLAYTPNQDAGSIQADPLYVNAGSNLQPSTGSPLLLAGAPKSGITTDILGVTRNSLNPTIGAYENALVPPTDVGVTGVVIGASNIQIISVGKGYDLVATVKNFGPPVTVDSVFYTVNGGSPVGPLSAGGPIPTNGTVNVTFNGGNAFTPAVAGINTIKVYTSLAADANNANDTTTVLVNVQQKIAAFPYVQTFTAPANWTIVIENAVGTTALWGLGICTNPAAKTPDTAATSNCFNGSAGRVEILRSPEMDISSLTNPTLDFYVAYRTFSTESDSMQVLVSTDGGVTFFSASTVFNKGNASTPSLATRPPATTSFFPDSSIQWRHETISLANVAGSGNIVIGFRSISQFGNRQWIDNVIVNGVSSLCTDAVTGPGTYNCNSLVKLDFTATPVPPPFGSNSEERSVSAIKDTRSDNNIISLPSQEANITVLPYNQNDNPTGGDAFVSQYTGNDPGQTVAPNVGFTNATPPIGPAYDPTFVYHDYWFTTTYTGNDKTGYATYTIRIDLDGLVFTDPSTLYIVKRADRTGSWICQNTTMSGNTLIVTGLTTFSDFAIAGSEALPVELASFVSTISGRNVELNWSTASENNNSGFDIERSSVNGSWSKIGNVAGNGTTSTGNSYSYTDRNIATGNYNYRLKQIDFNGNFEYFNLSNEVVVGIPTKFDLSQNYPNPFNPSTKINFDLPTDGKVSLKIFDMSGKEIMTLVNEVKTAGYYSVNFNASNLSSGVYFYSLSANNFTATKKMMLLK